MKGSIQVEKNRIITKIMHVSFLFSYLSKFFNSDKENIDTINTFDILITC